MIADWEREIFRSALQFARESCQIIMRNVYTRRVCVWYIRNVQQRNGKSSPFIFVRKRLRNLPTMREPDRKRRRFLPPDLDLNSSGESCCFFFSSWQRPNLSWESWQDSLSKFTSRLFSFFPFDPNLLCTKMMKTPTSSQVARAEVSDQIGA